MEIFLWERLIPIFFFFFLDSLTVNSHVTHSSALASASRINLIELCCWQLKTIQRSCLYCSLWLASSIPELSTQGRFQSLVLKAVIQSCNEWKMELLADFLIKSLEEKTGLAVTCCRLPAGSAEGGGLVPGDATAWAPLSLLKQDFRGGLMLCHKQTHQLPGCVTPQHCNPWHIPNM